MAVKRGCDYLCRQDPGLTSSTEPVDRRGFKRLALPECRRRERWLIRCIGIVLRLETKPIATLVNLSALTRQRPIQKIPRIKLHAGLGGPHLHYAP